MFISGFVRVRERHQECFVFPNVYFSIFSVLGHVIFAARKVVYSTSDVYDKWDLFEHP